MVVGNQKMTFWTKKMKTTPSPELVQKISPKIQTTNLQSQFEVERDGLIFTHTFTTKVTRSKEIRSGLEKNFSSNLAEKWSLI